MVVLARGGGKRRTPVPRGRRQKRTATGVMGRRSATGLLAASLLFLFFGKASFVVGGGVGFGQVSGFAHCSMGGGAALAPAAGGSSLRQDTGTDKHRQMTHGLGAR